MKRQQPYFLQGGLDSGFATTGPLGPSANQSQYRLAVRYGRITGLAPAGGPSILPSYYFEEVIPEAGGQYESPPTLLQYGVACSSSSLASGQIVTGLLYETSGNADVPTDGSVIVPILPRFTIDENNLAEWYFTYQSATGTLNVIITGLDGGDGPFATTSLTIGNASSVSDGMGGTFLKLDSANWNCAGLVNTGNASGFPVQVFSGIKGIITDTSPLPLASAITEYLWSDSNGIDVSGGGSFTLPAAYLHLDYFSPGYPGPQFGVGGAGTGTAQIQTTRFLVTGPGPMCYSIYDGLNWWDGVAANLNFIPFSGSFAGYSVATSFVGGIITAFSASGAGTGKSGTLKPGATATNGYITSLGSGSYGTVSSVSLSVPSGLSVSGSPVTSSGTLTITWSSQSANLVLASPDGSSGTPTFRAIAPADLGSIYRAGSVAVTVLGGVTYTVTFSSALPSTNYAIALSVGGIGATVSYSSKSTTGFTITLSAAIAGNVDWTATVFA